MMLGNKECHFPASRLDEISRQLSPVSVGEELPTIACVVAATTLQYISLSNQEDVGKALDRLEHFKNAYLKYQLDLCTRNILVPITPALGELDTLIRFIDANPIQLDRYRCLRELTPDQPKGPLCGLHRDAWKDFSLSFQDKKHMWDYLTNLPDRAGDPEAFSKYAEEYILPAEHPNFLRTSNPAMSGKLLLHCLVRREECNIDFANKNFGLVSMCHMYNALRQFGYLKESWHALDEFTDLHIKTIFMGERPKASAQVMMNRAFLCFGLHSDSLRQLNDPARRTKDPYFLAKQKTKRSGKLVLSPFMSILADYVHDKETLPRTLYRMDSEMVTQASRTPVESSAAKARGSVKSYLDEFGPITFLDELAKHMRQLDRYFATGAIELSRTSNALFEKFRSTDEFSMYDTMALPINGGFESLSMMLHWRIEADKGVSGAGEIADTIARKAAAILHEYIQAGAKGVPE
jgi:hypothetical protein